MKPVRLPDWNQVRWPAERTILSICSDLSRDISVSSISRQPQSWASYAGPSQTRRFIIQHVEIPLRRQLLQRSECCLIVSFSAFKFWCIHNNQSKTAWMFVVLCHHYGVFWVKSQTFLNEGKTERTKEEICFFRSIFLRTFIRSIFFFI